MAVNGVPRRAIPELHDTIARYVPTHTRMIFLKALRATEAYSIDGGFEHTIDRLIKEEKEGR